MAALTTHAAPAIAERLVGELAHWRHEAGFLCRTYRTGSWRDFELAAKIEAVVRWRPGAESAALTGPPKDDARFRYLDDD